MTSFVSSSPQQIAAEARRFMGSRILWSSGFAAGLSLLLCLSHSAATFAVPADEKAAAQTADATWPSATQLIEQLNQLQTSAGQQVPAAAAWAADTARLLDSLAQQPLPTATTRAATTATPPELGASAKQHLAQLTTQAQHVSALVGSLRSARIGEADRQQIINQLFRVRYCLQRRVSVWQEVLALTANQASQPQQPNPFSLASRARISFHPLDSSWADYFLLDDVRREMNSLSPNRDQQRLAARRTLGRMYSPVLKSDQAQFVKRAFDPSLVSLLRQAATKPVQPHELMQRIERHEQRPTGATEYRLNDLYQSLLWSEQPQQQALAETIATHYRNANVRLSVSGELLNRLVPEMPTTRERVSENVLGAAVSGQSHISNRLQVELIPDPNQVQLRLKTVGTVHSNTVARRDGFAIQNQGLARFQVFKRLAFGREGIDVAEQPVAYSTANQQVVGMRSNLDGFPIVGALARKIASQKIRDQAPQAKQLVRDKIERQASDRMQEQVEVQLTQMRSKLYENVLQPLLALELEPEPVQMSTTQQELVMRYRLAGRDQMAASTARPAALPNSLCSCQLHESVINNTIMRLGLNGNRFTATELKAHLQDVLGQQGDPAATDADEPKAMFEFAHLDPLRVCLENEQLTLQLNLKSMRIGEGKSWRRLTVTTAYVPRVVGGNIVFEQAESGIRLKGQRLRFRDQVAVRTVFEVLFKSQYQIPVLTPQFAERVGGKLAMTQLTMVDGWLGLSIDDLNRAVESQPARVGTNRPNAARRSRR